MILLYIWIACIFLLVVLNWNEVTWKEEDEVDTECQPSIPDCKRCEAGPDCCGAPECIELNRKMQERKNN